jgi:hypothetical protein
MRRLLLTLALLAFIIVPIPAHAQGQEDCFGVHATLTPADGFTNANGDFEIDGTADADVIVGSDPGDANNPSGNDVIFGNGGDDTICAGDGVDMVSGNGGADTISLGPGGQTDAIRACADPVNAEVGTGGPGTDYLEGNGGDDCIRGGPDNDALIGG